MSTYNGWANYETWNVKLWLDNDEGTAGYWAEQADAALENNQVATDESRSSDGTEYDTDLAACDLAERLESEVKEQAPDLGASCYADLLGAALGEVNWREIAESYVSDAKERVAA